MPNRSDDHGGELGYCAQLALAGALLVGIAMVAVSYGVAAVVWKVVKRGASNG